MAWVRLERREIERRDLPYVCLKCGRPAAVWKDKRFDWESGTSAALRVLGPVPAGPTVMKAKLPMCRRHRHHWRWRSIFGWGVGGVVVALFLLGLAAVAEPTNFPPAWVDTFRRTLPFGFLGTLIWIPTILVLLITAVRPVEITKDDITLAGVSDEFVEQRNAYRRLSPEERKAARKAHRDREAESEA